MSYHIKNKNNKKEMKKVRKHPLPTLLMAHLPDYELKRYGINDGRISENTINSEDIQVPKNDH